MPDPRDATQFASPDELWRYSMNVVALLRAAGDLAEAANLLEHGVRHVTSSGWEWLGELGHAAQAVKRRFRTPPAIRRALDIIIRTARSKQPYAAPRKRTRAQPPRLRRV